MTTTNLRAVTHRLTTTPVDQLPAIASFLATSLSDCAELLSAPQAQKPGKSESDNAVQIHKLKTRLASLLQDRSVEGRWTAVVLVKATVEAGQWEILRGYEPIVRNLIGILAKPDPVSTRKMCIVTLTRIFHLTYQYPTLVREITTPHLPGFINAVLNLVSALVKLPSGSSRKAKPNTPFMETVLHAVLELVPRHPTIFRPFGSQLRSLLAEILGCSPPAFFPEPVIDAAAELFASLHKCAPKDKAGTGWTDDCRSTIVSIHRAADYVFRAVVEQWESVDATLAPTRQDYAKEMADEGSDALGLPTWKGIHSGVDRLVILLRVLSEFITMPSASAVAIPIGQILDLTSRLTSVTVPADNAQGSQGGVQVNPQVSREEREMLWAELPRIHVACMEVLNRVVAVLEKSTTPLTQTMIEQFGWVFRNEKFSRIVRTATYDLLRSLVLLNGPAMTKQSVASIANILRFVCIDLLAQSVDSESPAKSQSDSKSKSKTGQGAVNADFFLNPELQKNRSAKASQHSPELQKAASGLLQSVLASIPPELLTASVRAEIDRTIILSSDKDAMLASVLNPVPSVQGRPAGASIMPFLVQIYSDQMEVEALVRPRMPVLMTTPELDAYAEVEDEEEAEEVADEAYNAAPETATFLKEPVIPPIQAQKAEPVAPLHKRTYVEETTAQPVIHTASSGRKPTPTKKARFEESVTTSPGQLPQAKQPAAAVTQVSTSVSQPAQVEAASVQNQTTITFQASTATASLPVDDSDDELPTLNVDPDTDDEDEGEDNEDVTMEG
ncbi:uncharacterized protein N7459_008071 [Penicillium hispanicum]|uniref:uncharacterized protein n=1 Tax=Penicillium hispanicum TaxID=1080232 RepID=UPI00253F7164|nr:uncharacterized protein N7459_008071 [Penicillium hispanicum]KAJ5573644.1 hypothetical protein N7459_008071 [Penicillium hispanicum]